MPLLATCLFVIFFLLLFLFFLFFLIVIIWLLLNHRSGHLFEFLATAPVDGHLFLVSGLILLRPLFVQLLVLRRDLSPSGAENLRHLSNRESGVLLFDGGSFIGAEEEKSR